MNEWIYLPTDEQKGKIECDTAIKKEKLKAFVGKWMQLKNILLNGVSHTSSNIAWFLI